MTAKQALQERVDELSEAEAAEWLDRLREDDDSTTPTSRFLDRIQAIWADVPEEEFADWPSSADIDSVVYGSPKGR